MRILKASYTTMHRSSEMSYRSARLDATRTFQRHHGVWPCQQEGSRSALMSSSINGSMDSRTICCTGKSPMGSWGPPKAVAGDFSLVPLCDADTRCHHPMRAWVSPNDRDQLEFLGQRGRLPQTLVDRFLFEYDEILSKIPQDKLESAIKLLLDFWAKTIGSVYQRAFYIPEIEPLKDPALNLTLTLHRSRTNT